MICSFNSVHRTMLSIIQYVINVNLQSAFLIVLTLSSFSHSLLFFFLIGSLQFPLLTKTKFLILYCTYTCTRERTYERGPYTYVHTYIRTESRWSLHLHVRDVTIRMMIRDFLAALVSGVLSRKLEHNWTRSLFCSLFSPLSSSALTWLLYYSTTLLLHRNPPGMRSR